MAETVIGKTSCQTIEIGKCVDVTIGPVSGTADQTSNSNSGRLLIESQDPVKMSWTRTGIRLEAPYQIDADGWKSCKSRRGEHKVHNTNTTTITTMTGTGTSFSFSLLPQWNSWSNNAKKEKADEKADDTGNNASGSYRRSWTIDSGATSNVDIDKIRLVQTNFSDVRFKRGTPFAKDAVFQLTGNSHVKLDPSANSKSGKCQFNSLVAQTIEGSVLDLGGASIDTMVGQATTASRLHNFFVKTSGVFRAETRGIIHGRSDKHATIVETMDSKSKVAVSSAVAPLAYLWECFNGFE